MSGMLNDNLVFPILDLIDREFRKLRVETPKVSQDETPNIVLHRDDPRDKEVLTGVTCNYLNGDVVEVFLNRGDEDFSNYPTGITAKHPDFNYYRYERLRSVSVVCSNSDNVVISSINLSLKYDGEGLLKEVVTLDLERA